MTMGSIVVISLIVAIITYIVGIVYFFKKSRNNLKRIEVAKENNWFVKANCIERKMINTATGRDYINRISRIMYKATYEYELNGEKKKFTIKTYSRLPGIVDLYYDPEDGYKLLNKEDKSAEHFFFIPIAVFFLLAFLLKLIFNV